MHFSILILTIGIPGSGKTTWVREYVKEHPYTRVVSTDLIRKEKTGTEDSIDDPGFNNMIHEEARRKVKEIIDNPLNYGGNMGMGPVIIVDSTNVDVEEWVKYKELGPSIMLAKLFEVSPEEAMKRQSGRERQVPKRVLDDKWKSLTFTKQFIPSFFNMIL